jgi:caffeoyl-CoA O-methyltransferase
MGVPDEGSVAEHFGSLLPPRSDLLKRMEKEAEEKGVPIVGPMMGALLHLFALMSRSQKILELGTATGYSTVWLAQAAQELQGVVHTYERDEALAKEAKKNLKESGYESRVVVHQEDARKALPAMDDSFSMVFLDIEKEDYLPILPDIVDILKPRGLIVADNAAFEELKEFNQKLASTEGLDVVFVQAHFPGHSPERDGIAVARKRVT